MKVIAILKMGDSNSRYHIEGVLRSRKVTQLIVVRDHPIPELFNSKLRLITYSRPRTRLGIFFKVYNTIKNIIKTEKIDTIISFNAFPYGLIAKLISKRFSIPCHIGFVGSDVHRYESFFWMKPLYDFIKDANAITVTGKKMYSALLKLNFKDHNIYILPNAIPVNKIKKNSPKKCVYDLVFVGALNKVKDIPTIINAAGEAVRISNRSFKLCIVGDGSILNELKKIADQQPKGCIIDFTGYKKNPFEYLCMGKIFVMASKREGLPFSLIEAMCAGLVPVVTPVGSIREVVTHGKNGYLFEPGDYITAARYYVELINNPERYKNMREKVLEIRKKYSIENATSVWDRILNNNNLSK